MRVLTIGVFGFNRVAVAFVGLSLLGACAAPTSTAIPDPAPVTRTAPIPAPPPPPPVRDPALIEPDVDPVVPAVEQGVVIDLDDDIALDLPDRVAATPDPEDVITDAELSDPVAVDPVGVPPVDCTPGLDASADLSCDDIDDPVLVIEDPVVDDSTDIDTESDL